MFRSLGAAAAAMSMVCWSATAGAQNTAKWGEVGGWQIRVDRTVGDGCYAHQIYEDGTVIRLGFDMKKGSIYFMITNRAWQSLETGKLYAIRFVFDEQQAYNGELRGTKLGEMVWLDHSNVSTAFTKDFMQRSSLRVYYRGGKIAGLSLRNTYAAVTEVMNCQREMAGNTGQGGGQRTGDPFRSDGGQRSSDPFSR
jgi:hypothetical protein